MMRQKFATLSTSLLRKLPAEIAHEMGIHMLKHSGFLKWSFSRIEMFLDKEWKAEVKGIGSLAHPVGLAAGFDKNGVAINGCSQLGFSFIEVGTVTPKPQPGNAKPRIWRLPQESALINRMGFNNLGVENLVRNVTNVKRDNVSYPIGVNLGKNKATPLENAIEDYQKGFEVTRGIADYFVINISSPNTPGLRELASPEFIKDLKNVFSSVLDKTWVKLDPDMQLADFKAIIELIAQSGFVGVVLTNTHKVDKPHQGGMSGHVLATMSTSLLEKAWEVHKGSLQTISVGGIFCGRDVIERIKRGAVAVQIYTALIYQGPWAVANILCGMKDELEAMGNPKLSELFGSYYNK